MELHGPSSNIYRVAMLTKLFLTPNCYRKNHAKFELIIRDIN